VDVENKLGAGLIEEVIQVAEGELRLADILLQAKAYAYYKKLSSIPFTNLIDRWEDLEEKPVEGQWTYFQRDTAAGTT
jgi:NADH dehydrogenase (ubiquinone) 1 alpha subcomplex subunit 5